MPRKSSEHIIQMLNAQSVAVIGASETPGKIGYRVLKNLIDFEFGGRIYPVNSRLSSCQGMPCYPNISSLPETPDTVAIVLGARMVPEILRESGRYGVKTAVIISAGFGETGPEGSLLQSELADIANEYGIDICGPNSVGFIHTESKLALTFTEALTRGALATGKVGFVSQSGAFGTVLYAQARGRGIGINTYVSSGNEVTTGFGDYVYALLADPKIEVVGGYLEGLRESESLEAAAARSLELEKPIVALKVGRSERAGAAAASHTGSLVGNDVAYSAAFDRLGIVQVSDEQELLDVVDAFQTQKSTCSGGRVAIVSMSGGAGVLATDILETKKLELATMSANLQAALRDCLPAFASVSNPIDVTGQFVTNPAGIDKVIAAVASDSEVDVVIVYVGLAWSGPEVWQDALEYAATLGSSIIVVAPLLEDDATFARELREAGVSVYPSIRQAVLVTSALVQWSRYRERSAALQPLGRKSAPDSSSLPAGTLDEAQAKQFLAQAGFRIPRGTVASNRAQTQSAALDIGELVVLKAQVHDTHHKSDIGGVLVGVSATSAAVAYDQLEQNVLAKGLTLDGVYVEEMVNDGLELMVGVVRAHPFGCLIVIGSGGVDVELKNDFSHGLAPLDEGMARTMIDSLAIAPKIRGYRGSEAYDYEGLVSFLMKFSNLVDDIGERLVEMDLNPICVQPVGGGVVVLDALMVVDSDELPE